MRIFGRDRAALGNTCGAKTSEGTPCGHIVNGFTTKCGAGHVPVPRNWSKAQGFANAPIAAPGMDFDLEALAAPVADGAVLGFHFPTPEEGVEFHKRLTRALATSGGRVGNVTIASLSPAEAIAAAVGVVKASPHLEVKSVEVSAPTR